MGTRFCHKSYSEPVICNRNGDLTKNWYVEYYYDGERFQVKSGKKYGLKGSGNAIDHKKGRSLYFQKLATLIHEKLKSGWSPKPTPKTSLSAQEMIRRAIEFKSHTSDENYKDYRDRGRRFIEFLESKNLATGPIEAVTKKDIQELVDRYESHNKNNYIRIIKALFSVLVEEEFTTHNPTTKIKKVKTKTTLHKTYDPETLSRIIKYVERYPYLRILLLLEYYQFVRPSEVLRIKTEHLDFEAKKLIIIQKKGNQEKIRILPMHSEIEMELKKLDLSGEYLFKNRKKDWLRGNWNRMKTKLEIPKGFTIYGFKHTGVCALYRATKDIYLVSRLCGHTSIQTTQIYLRSLGQDVGYLSVEGMPVIL